ELAPGVDVLAVAEADQQAGPRGRRLAHPTLQDHRATVLEVLYGGAGPAGRPPGDTRPRGGPYTPSGLAAPSTSPTARPTRGARADRVGGRAAQAGGAALPPGWPALPPTPMRIKKVFFALKCPGHFSPFTAPRSPATFPAPAPRRYTNLVQPPR